MASGIGYIRLLIEHTDNFLEERTHRMVIESFQLFRSVLIQNRLIAKIDARIDKLLDKQTEPVLLREAGNLVTEVELIDDLLHIFGEAIKVINEVPSELLLIGSGFQISQSEIRLVYERLVSNAAKSRVYVNSNAICDELLFRSDNSIVFRLKYSVKTPNNQHGKNHLPVVADIIYINQAIVGDPPDKRFQGIIS